MRAIPSWGRYWYADPRPDIGAAFTILGVSAKPDPTQTPFTQPFGPRADQPQTCASSDAADHGSARMKFLKKLRGKSHKDDPITDEERMIIKQCIRPGDIVFDVGAHHGKWSESVLKMADARIHAFEASKDAHQVLQGTIADKVTLNWNAVSNRDEDLTFHVYRDDARLSSLHRRTSVEDELLTAGFDAITVPGTTMDTYWSGRTEQIRFLKVDVEGAEYDVLRGTRNLLRRGQVDFLQFEYGGTFLDAGTSLRNVWSYLRRFGYRVLRVHNGKFTEVKKFTDKTEDYSYSNYLALHERLMKPFLKEGGEIELDFDRMAHFGIKPTGVLHVGGHEGNEITTYRAKGISPVVFVEANPDLAGGLRDRFTSDSDVTVIESAAAEEEGQATFNITSMNQSSSLLELKDHAKLYPKIGVEKKITVRTALIDTLLDEAGIEPSTLDFIAMDIQGAELKALKGATGLLKHIKALQIEVNYSELYDGCPLIHEIDVFLEDHGFIRVMTNTPYSEEWGDALYVRRPLVGCSVVGSMGRFANQVFQYLFIQTYAREYDYTPVNSTWAGDDIFNVTPGLAEMPELPFKIEEQGYELSNSTVANDPEVRPATDFAGFFQYHTRYYKPYKELMQAHFAFKGAYGERAAQLKALFDAQPGPVVPLHLRRGDFGTGVFFIAPEAWYLDWLQGLREKHPDLTLYIASDDPEAVLPAFKDFNVITEKDLPETDLEHGFFTDFAALTMGDHLAISNSSFSFAASMLNQTAQTFMRPDLTQEKLIDYDPWNAPVLLRKVEAEDAGEAFMSEKAKGRSKYKWRKVRKIFK